MTLSKNNTKASKPTPNCSSIFAKNTPISDIIFTGYEFPYADTIPANHYASTIANMLDSKTARGKDALDVFYDLEDESGTIYHMLLRYPIKSFHMKELTKALQAEGLASNCLADAIGGKENITLEYADDGSMGEITARSRYVPPVPANKGLLGHKSRKGTFLHAPVQDDDIDDELEDDLSDLLEDDDE